MSASEQDPEQSCTELKRVVVTAGKLRSLPSCYSRLLERRQARSELMFKSRLLTGPMWEAPLWLSPSNAPSKLDVFLKLAEVEKGFVPYNEILFDGRLRAFAQRQGVASFMVMMYKLDKDEDEALETWDDVQNYWALYLVAFVNKDG
ncbi:hypothetical protein BJ508DRAFT_309104 [Ascobolus immersus RN42]|uniref:Uncharacterized protein n=1 Tax=Ascobolus immersus RN42 TaxID=1160509 RepID=A0A3N4HZR5_ASCIM|nr:hypothetical protein BJ508DRAFT_309104 [Ascobolus immersus RN42]